MGIISSKCHFSIIVVPHTEKLLPILVNIHYLCVIDFSGIQLVIVSDICSIH